MQIQIDTKIQIQILIEVKMPDSTNQSDSKISPGNQGDQSEKQEMQIQTETKIQIQILIQIQMPDSSNQSDC